MGNTPTWVLPYPALSAAPNVPLHMQALADRLEVLLTGIDTRLDALELPATSSDPENSFLATTSTTYTAAATGGTSADCAAIFTAPASGVVLVLWEASCSHNTNLASIRVSPQLRTGSTIGSGTIITAADDTRALLFVVASTSQESRQATWTRISGLTPGASYNVRLLHRTSSGTASITHRDVVVVPLHG